MNNSIKTWMMTAIMAICCLTASAQAKQRLSREQLAERQARHIAQKLALDDKTTKLFTDTYCQYQKEVWALEPKKEKKPETNAAESGEEKSERQIKAQFAHSQKILDLRQKYYGIYSTFLTQKQIQQAYQLERQMMRRLANRQTVRKPQKRNLR